MKLAVILAVAAFFTVSYARPGYTTKYDNIDLDEILQNHRLLKAYYECLEGTKTCTKDGQELKTLLPDALKTKCASCNEHQKQGAEKVIRHLIDNNKDWWKNLEAIYDPDGIYRKEYEEEASKRGISIPS